MNELKTCNHTLDNGQPCRAAAVRNTPYCYFHRKFYNPPALPGESGYQAPLLESHEAIQLALTQLYQSFLTGKIALKEANFGLQILRLASKTIAAIEKAKHKADAKEGIPNQSTSADLSSRPGAKQTGDTPTAAEETLPNQTTSADSSCRPGAKQRGDTPTATVPAYTGDRIVDPYGCLAHLKS